MEAIREVIFETHGSILNKKIVKAPNGSTIHFVEKQDDEV
jgi:hypothetical protein